MYGMKTFMFRSGMLVRIRKVHVAASKGHVERRTIHVGDGTIHVAT